MSTFLKYLLSLAFHMAWQRAGKSGPIPRVPKPGGKGSLPLPVIGPWQMLLISWAVGKLWQRYGDDVRAKIGKVDHPVAERIHDWMPSTNPRKQAARSKSEPPTTFVIPGIPATSPAGAPAANAATRRLPHQTPKNNPELPARALSQRRMNRLGQDPCVRTAFGKKGGPMI